MFFNLITEVGYALSTEIGAPLVGSYEAPSELGPVIITEFSTPLGTERGHCIAWHSHGEIARRGPSLITEYGQTIVTGSGAPIVWRGISQSVSRRYVRVVPTNGSTPRLIDMPAVSPSQLQTCAIDYGKFLPPGVTLEGVPDLCVSVHFGDDNHPSSRISAGPVIGTISTDLGGTGRASAAILFQVYGGLAGVTYLLAFHCERSDGDAADNCIRLACVAKS